MDTKDENIMEKLTDFKPIKRLELPGLGEIICTGLTVIVGPNSSGKSQLLRDIKEKISGEPRDIVVASILEIETPDYQPFLDCLKKEGYLYSTLDNNDKEQYIPMTTSLGTGQGAQNVGSVQLRQWQNRSAAATSKKRKNEYFDWASKYLVTALFLENRLTSLTSVPTIDFEKTPPNNDLHTLHLNDEARQKLTQESQRAFSKAIWSDASRGNTVCLRIAEDGQVPEPQARLSVHEMKKYRTIESEGDGMKSYIATAISLLLGRRPVSVIDEPEMCLHPPQSYNLGQFIGQNATSDQTATFVATHSSQILRGIIQTAASLQIIRLTKNSNGFSAKHVDSGALAEAMKKPTVRAETVLDGIFAQAVAIVEGDGDRIVYQAVWEQVGAALNFDIHFTTVGGTGGIADTCNLYKILGIPVAIIADLDVITDTVKMKQMLTNICDEDAIVSNLMKEVESVAEEVRTLPPTISEEQALHKLNTLASGKYSWAKRDDIGLRCSLSTLRSSLNAMSDLKGGGISKLPSDLAERLGELIEKLRIMGVFIVDVGELEEWLAGCNIDASKRKKWAWANEAAKFIQENPTRDDDIWGFTRELGDYLTKHFN